MIKLNYFKDGKENCLTFSYDDGCKSDIRLIDIFNRYGMKATFHLNNKNLALEPAEELRKIYAGHEIAGHGENHASLDCVPTISMINEILNNRKLLEEKTGELVRGFSYANGRYNEKALSVLQDCGIVYSRTVNSTGGFGVPKNFITWDPTCHHNSCIEIGKDFLSKFGKYYAGPRLMYVWGHSYEFERQNNFELMEEFCTMMAHNDEIWYATNMEIYEYIIAQRSLIISADEKIIKNPTYTDVWIAKDGQKVCIKAGETVRL